MNPYFNPRPLCGGELLVVRRLFDDKPTLTHAPCAGANSKTAQIAIVDLYTMQ